VRRRFRGQYFSIIRAARQGCVTSEGTPVTDDSIVSDAVAATAFRRLLAHLRHRSDVQNIDLMGHAGFCRNCLADWIMEAANAEKGGALTRDQAREIVHGIPFSQWKERHQGETTPEQIERMKESVAKNADSH
jgi:hypothetical protein